MIRRLFLMAIATLVVVSEGCSSVSQVTERTPPETYQVKSNSSLCRYSPGQSKALVIGSTLLTLKGIIEDGAIAILENGTIAAVDQFDTVRQTYLQATLLDCRGTTVLSPGWVNAHEHEAYSYAFPNPEINPNYQHRDEWRFGVPDEAKPKLGSPKPYHYDDGSNAETIAILAWVEIRHLLSGTTTIAGSGAVPGLAKNVNLRKEPRDESIYVRQADNRTFPFSSSAVKDFTPLCQGGSGTVPAIKIDSSQTDIAYVPHVGEGARDNCTAQQEVKQYVNYLATRPPNNRRLSLIHGVAASEVDFQFLAGQDVTLIWSPRSNMALYGQTIDLKKALTMGTQLALATDWSPSGSFTMLEEFDCAIQVAKLYNQPLKHKDLWRMATYNASYALGLETYTGQLKPGLQADLILARKAPEQDPYRAMVAAKPADILSVWVDGQVQVIDQEVAQLTQGNPHCRMVDSVKKALCFEQQSIPVSWEDMIIFNENSVPLAGAYERQATCIQ